MRGVVLTGTGGYEVLPVREMPDPAVGAGEAHELIAARRNVGKVLLFP